MTKKRQSHHTIEPSYAKAFAVAIALHLLVVASMYIQFHTTAIVITPGASPVIVQAKVVNKDEFDQELARIKKSNDNKRDKELARKEEIARKLAEAQKKAEEEKQRLADLKTKREEQKKLAEEQAKAEKQRLADAQKKLEQEQKKLVEEQKKLQEVQKKTEQAEKLATEQAAKQKEEQAVADADAQAKKDQELLQQKKQRDSYVASLVSKYIALVNQKISRNWMVQEARDGIFCRLSVRVAPGGTVLDVQVAESSGSEAFDRSAIQAVYKASPLPVPTEQDAFDLFRELRLTLRPEEIISTGA